MSNPEIKIPNHLPEIAKKLDEIFKQEDLNILRLYEPKYNFFATKKMATQGGSRDQGYGTCEVISLSGPNVDILKLASFMREKGFSSAIKTDELSKVGCVFGSFGDVTIKEDGKKTILQQMRPFGSYGAEREASAVGRLQDSLPHFDTELTLLYRTITNLGRYKMEDHRKGLIKSEYEHFCLDVSELQKNGFIKKISLADIKEKNKKIRDSSTSEV